MRCYRVWRIRHCHAIPIMCLATPRTCEKPSVNLWHIAPINGRKRPWCVALKFIRISNHSCLPMLQIVRCKFDWRNVHGVLFYHLVDRLSDNCGRGLHRPHDVHVGFDGIIKMIFYTGFHRPIREWCGTSWRACLHCPRRPFQFSIT